MAIDRLNLKCKKITNNSILNTTFRTYFRNLNEKKAFFYIVDTVVF